ncbi:MAG: hypothetical protein LBR22_04060 [Desulfovibrio sp.]|jgi:transcriptional regulator with XRE-family HTH domain|nr:hypothetical protein [Desulfovibrio sp.]
MADLALENYSHRPRMVRLKAWLLLNDINSKHLAAKLGISPQLMSMTLSGMRPDADRINSLVELGIPRDLLPPPHSAPDPAPNVRERRGRTSGRK